MVYPDWDSLVEDYQELMHKADYYTELINSVYEDLRNMMGYEAEPLIPVKPSLVAAKIESYISDVFGIISKVKSIWDSMVSRFNSYYKLVDNYLKNPIKLIKRALERVESIGKDVYHSLKSIVYNVIHSLYDIMMSIIHSFVTFSITIALYLLQWVHGVSVVLSTLASLVIDDVLNLAEWSLWRFVINSLNDTIKMVITPAHWVRQALMLQLGTVFSTIVAYVPAVFWLQGKFEFLRTGVWDVTDRWNWAGFNCFEIVAMAKRWMCWPLTKKILKSKKKVNNNITKSVSLRAKDVDKLIPVTFYNRYKGVCNKAYKVGYMIERMLDEDDVYECKQGDDTAPYCGLFLASYGCNAIFYPRPIVRRLLPMELHPTRVYKFYVDDVGRTWVHFDGYGTIDDVDHWEIKNYDNSNCLILKGDRTWIEEGVDGVVDLMSSDLRFTTLRLRARARRLFNDIRRLLYPVFWSKDLRERGVKVPQVPATAVHIDCLERHRRYFLTL